MRKLSPRILLSILVVAALLLTACGTLAVQPAGAAAITSIYVKAETAAPPPTSTTPAPSPTETLTPTPTETAAPTETVIPTETAVPTETVLPTETVVPTETEVPTETAIPTETATPTETAMPTETAVPTETAAPTETAMPTETATPTETMTPLPSETVTPSSVRTSATVTISVQNFNLVEASGGAPVPGQGHVNYYLDTFPPTEPGIPAIPATGNVVEIADTTFTWSDITPGLHFFAVQLVNNDETPLDPPVVSAVLFNVPSVAGTTIASGAVPALSGAVKLAYQVFKAYQTGADMQPENSSTPVETETTMPTETVEPSETMTPSPTMESPAPTTSPETTTVPSTTEPPAPSGEIDVTVNLNLQNASGLPEGSQVLFFMDMLNPAITGGLSLSDTSVTVPLDSYPSYTWTAVSPGWHFFGVQIVNSEMAAVTPEIVSAAIMYVPSSGGAAVIPEIMPTIIGSMPAITAFCVTAHPAVPTPSPSETIAPSPSETMAPSPSETAAPSPSETVVPSPSETAVPSPTETMTPSPSETLAPSPSETAAPSPSETVVPSPSETAAPSPTETMTPSPSETATPVPATIDVRVTVTVQNFQVTDNVGGAESAGQGHLVFYMDIFPPTQKGQSALPRIGNAVSVTDTTYTWGNVSAGPHLFSVQLVNNDDTPLDPPVVAAVIFEVPSSVSQTNQQVAAALSSNPAITSITVEVLPGTSTPTMTNTAIR